MKRYNETWQWCYDAVKKVNSSYQRIVYCSILDEWIILVDSASEYASHEALRSMNFC